jgi:hypothetical protein
MIENDKTYWKLLKEAAKVKIPVKHPGVLEVPEGKDVESLPYSHFAALVKKKGYGEIAKALTNLIVWNKKKNPPLSKWADGMQNKLHDEFSEEATNEAALFEKWKKDVEVKATGEHAGKSIQQLKDEIKALKGKPGNKEKMGELLFALRAKQGWKRHTGA